MTRIDFHVNVTNPLQYVCRLLRKAHHKGAKVVCHHPDAQILGQLDAALWTFADEAFLPHCFATSPLAAQTPVLLTDASAHFPHYEVLVNLSNAEVNWFARFDRLIEIVGTQEEDKHKARERYRFYKERGYVLNMHDQGAVT